MTAHAGGASLTDMISLAERARLRDEVRREMRRRRRALSPRQRAAAALQLAHVARRHRLLQPGKHIAVYTPHAGEADLGVVIDVARRRNCILYLPAITDYRGSAMTFVRFDPRTRLRTNRYGILEPDPRGTQRVAVRRLDLILVPLLAFDPEGWRLGSGAGFYDRCLRHLRAGRRWRRPRLVGIAYEFQGVARLDHEAWDVPLDGVLTEKKLHRAQRPSQRNNTLHERGEA